MRLLPSLCRELPEYWGEENVSSEAWGQVLGAWASPAEEFTMNPLILVPQSDIVCAYYMFIVTDNPLYLRIIEFSLWNK